MSLVKFITPLNTYFPAVASQLNISEFNITKITGDNEAMLIDVGHEIGLTAVDYQFGVDFDSNKEIDIVWSPVPYLAVTKIKLGSKYFASVPSTSDPTYSTDAFPRGTVQKVTIGQYDAQNNLIASEVQLFQTPPATPRKLYIKPTTITSTSATIRWGSLSNISETINYLRVYVDQAGTTTPIIKSLNELVDENEFTLTSLASMVEYTVWISCLNSRGESLASNRIKFTTL